MAQPDITKPKLKEVIKGKCVVVDLEYLNENLGNSRPRSHHWKEVVMISAILFDFDQGTEIAQFVYLVKPIIYGSKISNEAWEYFENKTHVTHIQRQLIMSYGKDFVGAFEAFQKFCGEYPVLTMGSDQEVFECNFKLRGLEIPSLNFIRMREALAQILKVDLNKEYLSSDKLYQKVKLTREFIDGADPKLDYLFNVRSLARTINILLRA